MRLATAATRSSRATLVSLEQPSLTAAWIAVGGCASECYTKVTSTTRNGLHTRAQARARTRTPQPSPSPSPSPLTPHPSPFPPPGDLDYFNWPEKTYNGTDLNVTADTFAYEVKDATLTLTLTLTLTRCSATL